jgi:hypothetical protein
MPSFDEDVIIRQHDLHLHDGSGTEVVRIEADADLIVGYEPAPAKEVPGARARREANGRPGGPHEPPMGPGTIRVVGLDGSEAIVLEGFERHPNEKAVDAGSITLRANGGEQCVRLDGSTASVALGGAGRRGGGFLIRDEEDRATAHIAGGFVDLGAEGGGGRIYVRDDDGRVAIELDGHNGRVSVAGPENEGAVVNVRDREGRDAIILDATGSDPNGRIEVRDRDGRTALRFDAGNAELQIGADGTDAELLLCDHRGEPVLRFDAAIAWMDLGAEGNGGELIVRDPENRPGITLSGSEVKIGSSVPDAAGRVVVRDAFGADAIELDGASADIKLLGADLAEDFAVAAPVEPGAVVVATGPDAVAPAGAALDRRVVGVVSGAGDFQPALRLGSKPGGERVPVAIVGRAACLVDAAHGPIEPGDLLTTSPTEGHAMRVGDAAAAAGAILGKALGSLRAGTGLVPVLLMLR